MCLAFFPPAASPKLHIESVSFPVVDTNKHQPRTASLIHALTQSPRNTTNPSCSHLRTQIPEKIWSHPPEWVLSHVRAGQDVFNEEIEEAGFVLEREVTLPNLRENYFLIFVNP